jgi:hypothetical protein
MHAKNPVKHVDYDIAGLIYSFESFEKLFHSIKILQSALKEVTNKINYIREALAKVFAKPV